MTVFNKEIRQLYKSTLGIALLLSLFILAIVLIYPQFAQESVGIIDLFRNVSFFTDVLNVDLSLITSLAGYYGLEFEYIVGLIGSIFVAYITGNLIVKEEKDHTAEFLYTLPHSRLSILFQKLLAVVALSLMMHLIILGSAYLTITLSGQEMSGIDLFNLQLAAFLCHLIVGFLSLGITELLPGQFSNLGPIVVIIQYLMSVLNNMVPNLPLVRWITPFSFSYSADILQNGAIERPLVASNFAVAVLVLLLGAWRFNRRDIHA